MVWFESGGLGVPSSPASGMIPSIPAWAEHASVTKAKLEFFKPGKNNDAATKGASVGGFDFTLNPNKLSLSKEADWHAEKSPDGKSTGPTTFKGSSPSSLTLEIFLDATEKQDDKVMSALEKLAVACVPADQGSAPPWVQFSWGPIKSFIGYISGVTADCTMFTPTGMPLRATAKVTLKELPKSTPGQNPTSGTKEPRRVHVAREGDSLAGLAFKEYGDPGLWRVIAEVNRIDDPMRMHAGARLLLPSPKELDSLIQRPARLDAVAVPEAARA